MRPMAQVHLPRKYLQNCNIKNPSLVCVFHQVIRMFPTIFLYLFDFCFLSSVLTPFIFKYLVKSVEDGGYISWDYYEINDYKRKCHINLLKSRIRLRVKETKIKTKNRILHRKKPIKTEISMQYKSTTKGSSRRATLWTALVIRINDRVSDIGYTRERKCTSIFTFEGNRQIIILYDFIYNIAFLDKIDLLLIKFKILNLIFWFSIGCQATFQVVTFGFKLSEREREKKGERERGSFDPRYTFSSFAWTSPLRIQISCWLL